jgi:hypothetical protein
METSLKIKIFMLPKIKSVLQLYELLPEDERILVDVLRGLARHHLPPSCKEKIAYNVPYFYGKRGICIIWPATIPRGGIKSGVLFGFWQGNRLRDPEKYLDHGTNKKVFYRIFHHPKEIDEVVIAGLLAEAVRVDQAW